MFAPAVTPKTRAKHLSRSERFVQRLNIGFLNYLTHMTNQLQLVYTKRNQLIPKEILEVGKQIVH